MLLKVHLSPVRNLTCWFGLKFAKRQVNRTVQVELVFSITIIHQFLDCLPLSFALAVASTIQATSGTVKLAVVVVADFLQIVEAVRQIVDVVAFAS